MDEEESRSSRKCEYALKRNDPDDGESEIAPRQLHDLEVPEAALVAPVGERVFVPARSFDLPRQPQEHRGVAQEIERHVGERDVLFENRPVPAPLGGAVAEDEPIVAESEQVLEQRRAAGGRADGPVTQKTFTPRGVL